MRSTIILNSDGLQSGPPSKASEDDKRLLLIASPNLSNVKQEVTYTHAPSALTLGHSRQPSKRRSWQASLSACDYCHETPHASEVMAANALSSPDNLTSVGPKLIKLSSKKKKTQKNEHQVQGQCGLVGTAVIWLCSAETLSETSPPPT